jgi:hypothetical protein
MPRTVAVTNEVFLPELTGLLLCLHAGFVGRSRNGRHFFLIHRGWFVTRLPPSKTSNPIGSVRSVMVTRLPFSSPSLLELV